MRRIAHTALAARALDAAPESVQVAFWKQIAYLRRNLRHPSLRAKKFDERRDIWQPRVTGSWRFYFRIVGDAYLILDIVPHPK